MGNLLLLISRWRRFCSALVFMVLDEEKCGYRASIDRAHAECGELEFDCLFQVGDHPALTGQIFSLFNITLQLLKRLSGLRS